MKITVEQEKPVFKPITITLETAQEYFSLLAALCSGTYKGELEQLALMGIIAPSNYNSPASLLNEQLNTQFSKVKETL